MSPAPLHDITRVIVKLEIDSPSLITPPNRAPWLNSKLRVQAKNRQVMHLPKVVKRIPKVVRSNTIWTEPKSGATKACM